MSSSDLAVSVRGLGKSYTIAHQQGPAHNTLAEQMLDWVRHPLRRATKETFWALKDVNFDIPAGEVVGIVGRNGAGKSTLLKILSRITEPTVGTIDLVGRVGSLLEVGTGFHPELTGRENIFLNGAILGMTKAEIRRQFDAIVNFAGVEQFLDTPVKRYSSGMYVRLAFAVAAHLSSDILIIDEVLAVGDAAFQAKCMGKMQDVAGQGRTVLFVSHQMNAVSSLCTQAVLLAGGTVDLQGTTETVLARYLHSNDSGAVWTRRDNKLANPHFTPERLEILGEDGRPLTAAVSNDTEVRIAIEGEVTTLHPALNVGFAVYASSGQLAFWSLTTDREPDQWPKLRPGRNRLVAALPRRFLNEGTYRVELIVSLHHIEWVVQPDVNAPQVSFTIEGGLSDSPYWMHARPGLTAPVLSFDVTALEV